MSRDLMIIIRHEHASGDLLPAPEAPMMAVVFPTCAVPQTSLRMLSLTPSLLFLSMSLRLSPLHTKSPLAPLDPKPVETLESVVFSVDSTALASSISPIGMSSWFMDANERNFVVRKGDNTKVEIPVPVGTWHFWNILESPATSVKLSQ